MDDHSTKSDLRSFAQEIQQSLAEISRKVDTLAQRQDVGFDQLNDQIQRTQDKISQLESKIH
jgi:peptidoglycan hydrolase CwlO-like protein